MELSVKDKFAVVLNQTFENVGVIIDELHKKGKTDLSAGIVAALQKYVGSLDKDYNIKSFIENSYNFWDDIHRKDEKCMVGNSSIIFGEHAKKPEFSSVRSIFTAE